MTGTFAFRGRTLAHVSGGFACGTCPMLQDNADTCVEANDAAKAAGLPSCFRGGHFEVVPKEEAVLLTEDPDHGDPAISLTYKPSHGGYPQGPAMPLASDSHSRANDTLVAALARTTDPEPSHKAAASVGGGKLVDLILAVMGESKLQRARVNAEEYGYTGKELSQTLGKPLNSITPRLAPMRRAGYIHADGTRNRETVWKLGNGVKA